MELPYIIPPYPNLKSVYSMTKHLFSSLIVPNARLAGQLKYFLSIVEGYSIPFDTIPHQCKTQKVVCENSVQKSMIDMEVSERLKKEAIYLVQDQVKIFLSNLFAVRKEDRGYCPVKNGNNSANISSANPSKFMHQQGNYMCKLDLKDAYFSI